MRRLHLGYAVSRIWRLLGPRLSAILVTLSLLGLVSPPSFASEWVYLFDESGRFLKLRLEDGAVDALWSLRKTSGLKDAIPSDAVFREGKWDLAFDSFRERLFFALPREGSDQEEELGGTYWITVAELARFFRVANEEIPMVTGIPPVLLFRETSREVYSWNQLEPMKDEFRAVSYHSRLRQHSLGRGPGSDRDYYHNETVDRFGERSYHPGQPLPRVEPGVSYFCSREKEIHGLGMVLRFEEETFFAESVDPLQKASPELLRQLSDAFGQGQESGARTYSVEVESESRERGLALVTGRQGEERKQLRFAFDLHTGETFIAHQSEPSLAGLISDGYEVLVFSLDRDVASGGPRSDGRITILEASSWKERAVISVPFLREAGSDFGFLCQSPNREILLFRGGPAGVFLVKRSSGEVIVPRVKFNPPPSETRPHFASRFECVFSNRHFYGTVDRADD